MTRRIALAILLTVWAVLVAGCVMAYTTVRWALVEQLDQSLIAKASTLPELARVPAGLPTTRPAAAVNRLDRYLIKAENGVTISPAAGGMVLSQVQPMGASFSVLAEGTTMRTMMVRGIAVTAAG